MAISILGGDGASETIGELNSALFAASPASFVSSLVGSGAAATGLHSGFTLTTPPSAIGSAARHLRTYVNGTASAGCINWTRPVAFSAKFISFFRFSDLATARASIGKAGGTVGTPSVRSIGFYQTASAPNTFNPLVLEVHDGTTLTTVTSSFTPTLNQIYDVVCYSDGNGNATLYVNGNPVATTTAAPKTRNTSITDDQNFLQFEVSQTVAPSAYESYFVCQQAKFISY